MNKKPHYFQGKIKILEKCIIFTISCIMFSAFANERERQDFQGELQNIHQTIFPIWQQSYERTGCHEILVDQLPVPPLPEPRYIRKRDRNGNLSVPNLPNLSVFISFAYEQAGPPEPLNTLYEYLTTAGIDVHYAPRRNDDV